MRAEDLRALEVLGQDPEKGFPLFGSARLMIMGWTAVGRLQRDLHELLGEEMAAKVSLRLGYEMGLASATNLAEIYDWDSDEEWFKAGSHMRKLSGFAREEITSLEIDRAKGVLRCKGTWRESFEAVMHLKNMGVAEKPVCDVLAGVASGYASAVLGSEVWVREITCQAQGYEFCTFEGRPAAEWGISGEEMRRTLELPVVKEEVARLQAALRQAQNELAHSQGELESLRGLGSSQEDSGFIYRSESMARVLELARKVAPTGTTALIVGETGTGKEVLARYIHRHSHREKEPYLAINCAALPPNLLESELFGHVRGAFTGADRDKKGLFVEAGAGTLFLDEVGELPLELQAKILRALQEREVRPVGGVKDQPVHARIVAATNRDLKDMVAGGRFREDLYYRLAVIPVHVPPLRERRADILPLARHFLSRYRADSQGFAPETIRLMEAHTWPGNVRELENAVEYASVLAGEVTIQPIHLPLDVVEGQVDPLVRLASDLPSQEELVTRYTEYVLKHTGGNKGQAARILGIGANTLWRRLKSRHEGEGYIF
jgi:DNA-binding NtrC family response regulator/predicted hydrocarbon binding protein